MLGTTGDVSEVMWGGVVMGGGVANFSELAVQAVSSQRLPMGKSWAVRARLLIVLRRELGAWGHPAVVAIAQDVVHRTSDGRGRVRLERAAGAEGREGGVRQ